MNNDIQYYLKVDFKDAGLFKTNSKTKDKIIDTTINSVINRDIKDNFKNPICLNHVYNMIHVLFGQRPVPINKTCLYPKVEYLVDKAKDSYIKINSIMNKKGELITESIQTKKSIYNSYPKVSYMNFQRVHKLLGDDLYDHFKSTIKKVMNIDIDTDEKLTYNDLKKDIQKYMNHKDIIDMFEYFKKEKKTPLYRNITDTGIGDIDKNKNTMLLNINGFDNYSKLSGHILIPMSNEDLKRLKDSPCNATILDGGVVFINKLIHVNMLDIYGYEKVGDINYKKYN